MIHSEHCHEESGSSPTTRSRRSEDERLTIQHWLDHTSLRKLKGTWYGVSRKALREPRAEVLEDPLLNQVYRMDIATFLTAERVSVRGISGLLRHAPDESLQSFMAAQTFDEARHFEVFSRRLADAGVGDAERDRLMAHVTTPSMQRFYDAIHEAVDRGDFAAGSLALNIILEGMAYPVYRYEDRYWSRMDSGLSQIIRGAFADEVRHVGFGERTLGERIRSDVEVRNRLQHLVHDYHRLMTAVFEEVIQHHIGLYQEAASGHMEVMGEIEIFSGRKMADVSEEEQVRILLAEVQEEYRKRLAKLGLAS